MNYRYDGRSEDEFKKDIKESSKKELIIAVRLCTLEYWEKGEWPELFASGADYTGELIKGRVTANPDFIINGVPVEITQSRTICKKFHQKVNKIKKTFDLNCDLIFINGLDASELPDFVRLKPLQLKELTEKSEQEFGIVKQPGHGSSMTSRPAYRYLTSWIENWESLPPLLKREELPDKYNKFKEMIYE